MVPGEAAETETETQEPAAAVLLDVLPVRRLSTGSRPQERIATAVLTAV